MLEQVVRIVLTSEVETIATAYAINAIKAYIKASQIIVSPVLTQFRPELLSLPCTSLCCVFCRLKLVSLQQVCKESSARAKIERPCISRGMAVLGLFRILGH